MAVPFYVPSDGGNVQSSSTSSTSSGSTATTGTNPGVVAPTTTQRAQIPHDPLLGALCEALYRVLLARQGQVAGALTLPPPSPTCSPYQFSPQPMTDVFFPSGSTFSASTPADHNTTLNYRLNEPLTPRSAQEFVFANASRVDQVMSSRNYDQDLMRSDENQRRRDEHFELNETVVGNEDLTVFNGTVPLQRRRRAKNKVNERGKEVLTWPVVTAVLVAVGCGILRATR